MFAILRHAHQAGAWAAAGALASAGHMQSLAASQDLAAGDEFAGHAMVAVSPELLEKEKATAKQGYCETALWNGNDLWGP